MRQIADAILWLDWLQYVSYEDLISSLSNENRYVEGANQTLIYSYCKGYRLSVQQRNNLQGGLTNAHC